MRCLAILLLLTLGPAHKLLAGELAVESDFSGGSAKVLEIDQAKRVIRIEPEANPQRGWECWWYFQVNGIEPGETITLDVGNAPWATPDQAAISTDNVTWKQTSPGKRDGKRIVYRHEVDGASCWFAWGPPFRVEDAQGLVDETAKSSPHATAFELCQTRAGRSVPALRVQEEGVPDEQRKGIWIQARQHAWESGSSWVCRGFVQWLLGDDPRAKALRQKARITIVPVMDIDNVAIGAGGKNQTPQDHNRDWSDQPHWNSVKVAQQQIQQQDKAGQFDLFVDLHNPGANDKNPYFYTTTADYLSEEGKRNLEHFLATARLEMIGPLAFKGETRESGPNYDKNWTKISKNWVTKNTAEGVVAVTLETSWNTPNSNQEGYMIVGRQLGMAIERYFRNMP
ncbi:Zinc carboxypeptidase [Bremerella volcania]|uniref:Zinc carboxypeptidase n=1 Tax=Bremerella volcania TaxID=2527984 RepID=A0A518C6V1_9BACT|nr:M14-type cytosolic carboxypeptidase [Bremerella volcania]QDU74932.1 Zinc carboxypeptidase [Bremerella volcania]